MDEGGLAEEIELLEAIYIEELEVQKNEKNEVDKIILQLHPATGEDLDKRFVCMTLILGLSTQYPHEPPDITIKNPRGIAEEELLSLREDMHKLCDKRKGISVLYELIELAKDSLTAGNIPHCPCMICLEHFHEGEKFTKTDCYHYFHENCLSRYVSHVLTQTPEIVPAHTVPSPAVNKLVCPVCREEINCKFDDLDMSPVEDKFVFVPTPELLEMQAHMASMFEEQKAKGGIIDVEAERNKYHIKHGEVVLLPPPKAESKQKPDKPKCGQSMSDIAHQEDRRGSRSEEMKNNSQGKRDNRNYRSERNDRFRYTRGRGRGSRFNGYDSPRDTDKRWHDRTGKGMTERRLDGYTDSKAENEANIRSDGKNVEDNSNDSRLGNRSNQYRNRDKDYLKKDRRKGNERKEETGDDYNSSEETICKTEERTKNERKGFGKPQRKDIDEYDIKSIEKETENDKGDVKNCRETNSERNEEDENDRVENRRGNGRRFYGSRGGFGRPPSRNIEKGEKFGGNNKVPRGRGFGRPNKEDVEYENQERENPRQNRGGFRKPYKYSKDSWEETVDAENGEGGNNEGTDAFDGRSNGGRFEDNDRHGATYKGEHQDGGRKTWRQQGKNESDRTFKYFNGERSFNSNNDRRNQHKDKSRYFDRFGKGRGKGNSANQFNKSESYNRNKSPRVIQLGDKGTESVDLKLEKMVLSDYNINNRDDRKIETSSRDSNKNEFSEGSKSLSSKGEEKDSESDKKTGPPGFVTKCPPGFESTSEAKSKAVVKPPPGFKS